MKILLTGGSGMVGRNILNLNQEHKIKFLHPTRSELNLLNAESVHSFLLKNKPDLIIHAAGKVGGIQAIINEPISYLYENMIM